jgi:hypothetical protein
MRSHHRIRIGPGGEFTFYCRVRRQQRWRRTSQQVFPNSHDQVIEAA